MKPGFPKTICAWGLFALCLLICRLVKSESLSYIFLVWNLFLAFVPYWISHYLAAKGRISLKQLPLLGLWLLFLPNAPYILTDLVHLRPRPGIPFWFDLVLISSFALSGLMLFYRSLADVLRLCRQQVRELYVNIALPFVFGIVAFGLYLGRYLRFNSWDVVQHPLKLARAGISSLHCKDTIGFVLVFGAFLWLIHMAISAFHRQDAT